MEVHKHPNHVTHKKKWNEYLLEFLMIFLAVFLGFIAENIRERRVELERANQLARNLYKELLNDSSAIKGCLDSRMLKEKECAYFINYVRDSSLTQLSNHFFPAFTAAFIQTKSIFFEPDDGILNQLRNSGELRYFRDPQLQAEIGNLGVKIMNVKYRNDKEYSFIESYTRPFVLKHYDFVWYDSVTQMGALPFAQALEVSQNSSIHFQLANRQIFSRLEAENICSYYLLLLRGSRQSTYMEYQAENHKVLNLLRQQYSVEIE